MNKTKFLEGLREALQGDLSAAEINNQLLYYERYMEEELKKGRTEKEILEELGSPRLIARTLTRLNIRDIINKIIPIPRTIPKAPFNRNLFFLLSLLV